MTVTIDKFGRVLIPKPLRDQLGLAAGAELSLDVQTGGDGAPALELRAVPDVPSLALRNGRLVYTGPVDSEGHDIVAFLQSQRLARARHLAGVNLSEGNDPEADAEDA